MPQLNAFLQNDDEDTPDAPPTLVHAVAKRMPQSQATEMTVQRSWNIGPSEKQRRPNVAQPAWKTEQQSSQPAVPKARLPVPTLMPTLTPVAEEDAEVVVARLEDGPWLAPEARQPSAFTQQAEDAAPDSLDALDEEPTLEAADWDRCCDDHVGHLR